MRPQLVKFLLCKHCRSEFTRKTNNPSTAEGVADRQVAKSMSFRLNEKERRDELWKTPDI